jgi:hypothetical protein
MRTAHRGALALSLALPLLTAGSCSFEALKIQLAGFGQGDIDGIWLWRRQSSGAYTRSCRIEISNPFLLNGAEIVSYDQTCPGGGATGIPMQARIQRLPSNPTTITVRLLYLSTGAAVGTYRASAYNAAGESPLSSTIAQL